MTTVSIVVVNWNSGQQLKECVDSILTHARSIAPEIIVVDNDSSDGSDTLAESLRSVELLRSGGNLGFARACNLGAARASGHYLLFLNPDARLLSGSLQSAVACMAAPANAWVGILGVQLVDEAGRVARSCARFPSAPTLLAHSVGIDRLVPGIGFAMREWNHGQTRMVDHVIGAYFLVRREVFDALNGFDERFFVYLEDVDFSARARAAGWTSLYLADAQAFHAGGGTSDQVKARRMFYAQRSRVLYAFKHVNFVGAVLVLMATLFVEPLSRSIFALSRGSWSAFKETWCGYEMLLRWLPQWMLKGTTR